MTQNDQRALEVVREWLDNREGLNAIEDIDGFPVPQHKKEFQHRVERELLLMELMQAWHRGADVVLARLAME